METLAGQLAASTMVPGTWVVVDDGSTDAGADRLRAMDLPFKFEVLSRPNGGGLIGGSAFTAWQHGVDYAVRNYDSFDCVMKLDADVDLPEGYLAEAVATLERELSIGLIGGVLAQKANREQVVHVPGPVKLYSARGYEALASLPRAVGFDVMDELAIKSADLRVLVRRDLPFGVRRAIGASQGRVHGRRRNGLVCRWAGYWTPYFLLHALRYVFRKPYLVGSVAMVYGYFRAGPSPYPQSLRRAHRDEQREKLRRAARSPRRWLRDTYGVST